MYQSIQADLSVDEISPKKLEEIQDLIFFPWTLRWLKGHEYLHIMLFMKIYQTNLGFDVLTCHPDWIYLKPQSFYFHYFSYNDCFYFNLLCTPSDGRIYYIQQEATLQSIGFPRVKGLRKIFKWRKMNFVTNLPKENPLV